MNSRLTLLIASAIGMSTGVMPARSQDSLATLTTTVVAGRSITSIRNASNVPLTACIVVARNPREGGGFGVSAPDSLLDSFREIPPHGEGMSPLANPDGSEEIRLIAALFTDGSTSGDKDWAKLLVDRRLIALDVLRNAIADLEAGIHMSAPEFLQFLDGSQSRRLSAATAIERKSNQAANLLPSNGKFRDLFEETTPELKAANIQEMTDMKRVSATRSYYRQMTGVLQPTSPGLWTDLPEQQRIQNMIDQFTVIRDELAASLPGLHAR